MTQYLVTLDAFLQWFGLSIGLLATFSVIYLWATPQHELQLIKEGNISAAICLSGTVLGYVLPLASVMIHGVNIVDFAIWGVIAMLVQLAVYFVMRLAFRDLTRHIIEDRISVSILVASVSLAVGILNAAAQSS